MQKSDAVCACDDMMLLQAPIFSATEVCLTLNAWSTPQG
jgi:hypothetical protein